MAKSEREQWKFGYALEELLAAAEAKLEHHTGRLEHWQGELEERERKLREEGIDFRPTVRPNVSNSSAYQQQPVFDNDLLKVYWEAQERVSYHTGNKDDYGRWVRALQHDRKLAGDTATTFELVLDDVEYFGL